MAKLSSLLQFYILNVIIINKQEINCVQQK